MTDTIPITVVHQRDIYRAYIDPEDDSVSVLLYVGNQPNDPDCLTLEQCPEEVQTKILKRKNQHE